jgi:hypothetical protein
MTDTAEASPLKRGRGRPRTLFAPGGQGDNLLARMRYADRVRGTTVGFAYERSGHFHEVAHIRRQADRDAAEVRAVVAEHATTRAIGFSRGARAIVGALVDDAALFDRIALVIPPANLRTRQRYELWLESMPGGADIAADVLVIGQDGDAGHPARLAEAWAQALGAHLELLGRRAMLTEADRVADLLAEFLDEPG